MGQLLRPLLLAAAACLGGYLIVSGVRDLGDAGESDRAVAADAASTRSVAARLHRTRPIEEIEVGQRVLARHPESGSNLGLGSAEEDHEPDWSRCSIVSLQMPLTGPSGRVSGGVLEIELLRPDEWFRERLVHVVRDKDPADSAGRSRLSRRDCQCD